MKSSEFREKHQKVKPKTGLDYRRKFYQTKTWRQIREAYRKKKRKEHEAIILDVYKNNLKKNDPQQLIKFFEDEKEYPLCELELEKGIIKCGNTLDHIIARAYSMDDSEENLQWICSKCHYKKTKKESKQQYE